MTRQSRVRGTRRREGGAGEIHPAALDIGDCITSHPYGIRLGHKGEMSERLKEHDWKSCVLAKTGTEGSNPSLSATLTAYLLSFTLCLSFAFFLL